MKKQIVAVVILLASHTVPVHAVSIKSANIRSTVIDSVTPKKKTDVNPDLFNGGDTYLEKSVSKKLGRKAENIKKQIIEARKRAEEKKRREEAKRKAEEARRLAELAKLQTEKAAVKKIQKAQEKALDEPTTYTDEPTAQPKETKIDETDIRKGIWDYLCSKGFTEAQTSGIMGNIQAESSFSTSDTNSSSGAYGLFQWLGGRKQNLMAFAGDKYNTAKAQIDFMLLELEGSESKAGDAIRLAQTPEDAAEVWDRVYERSEGTTTKRRQNYARAFYDAYSTKKDKKKAT